GRLQLGVFVDHTGQSHQSHGIPESDQCTGDLSHLFMVFLIFPMFMIGVDIPYTVERGKDELVEYRTRRFKNPLHHIQMIAMGFALLVKAVRTSEGVAHFESGAFGHLIPDGYLHTFTEEFSGFQFSLKMRYVIFGRSDDAETPIVVAHGKGNSRFYHGILLKPLYLLQGNIARGGIDLIDGR